MGSAWRQERLPWAMTARSFGSSCKHADYLA